MFLLQGCAAVLIVGGITAGASTAAYIKGDLEVTLKEDINSVYQACLIALDELEINVIKQQKDQLSARIIGRDAMDKKITLKMNSTNEQLTKLSVRVGIFGNKEKSQIIYQKIKENL